MKLFRKSIAGITKQFNTMVSDLQKLAEQNRAEAERIKDTANNLEAAAEARYRRELDVVDGLVVDAGALAREANDAERLAAKIAKTFSL